MLRSLIAWSVGNPLIVLLCVAALLGVGGYSFVNINVEAYPDSAPAIIEAVAQFPGASAEEVERQLAGPLEVTLAGMPGLKYTRSKSLAELSHLRNQFEYGFDYNKARQEVINRLASVTGLPPSVSPTLSPVTPTGELMRYTANCVRMRTASHTTSSSQQDPPTFRRVLEEIAKTRFRSRGTLAPPACQTQAHCATFLSPILMEFCHDCHFQDRR